MKLAPAASFEVWSKRLERKLTAVEIEFDSWIPSKKDKLRPRSTAKGGRGLQYKMGVSKAIGDLELQARMQWGDRAAVRHPELSFWLTLPEAQDRDNAVTTLLDALVKARVLAGDAVRDLNGLLTIHPATTVEPGALTQAVVRIDFEEAQCQSPPVRTAASHTRRSPRAPTSSSRR